MVDLIGFGTGHPFSYRIYENGDLAIAKWPEYDPTKTVDLVVEVAV